MKAIIISIAIALTALLVCQC